MKKYRPWIVAGLAGCLASAMYCTIDRNGLGPVLFTAAIAITGELVRRAGSIDDLGRRTLGRIRARGPLILLAVTCSATAAALAVLGVSLRLLWGRTWPAGAAWVVYLTITLLMVEVSICAITEVRLRHRAPVPPTS